MKRLAIIVFVSLTACTQTPTSDAVVLDEFSISLPAVDPGSSGLTVQNNGEFPHTLVISDQAGRVLVATETIDPGEELAVPVDLDGGRYQFSCRIVVETSDGGISDHYELGMVAELEL